VAACALALGACTPDFVTQDESEVILQITNISGDPGGAGQGSGDNALNSDVQPVFDDIAEITVQSIPKNASNILNSGRFQDVTISRYEVHYIRSDGRAIEGVDVPFHITGNISQTVPFRGTTTMVIDVVRHQAKLEPPLLNLVIRSGFAGGGAIVITCFAEITLHGTTPTGAAVQTSGRMQINFADFGAD
jgi:hypothetical protein